MREKGKCENAGVEGRDPAHLSARATEGQRQYPLQRDGCVHPPWRGQKVWLEAGGLEPRSSHPPLGSEYTCATRDLEGQRSHLGLLKLTNELLVECGANRYAIIAKDGVVVLRHSHH